MDTDEYTLSISRQIGGSEISGASTRILDIATSNVVSVGFMLSLLPNLTSLHWVTTYPALGTHTLPTFPTSLWEITLRISDITFDLASIRHSASSLTSLSYLCLSTSTEAELLAFLEPVLPRLSSLVLPHSQAQPSLCLMDPRWPPAFSSAQNLQSLALHLPFTAAMIAALPQSIGFLHASAITPKAVALLVLHLNDPAFLPNLASIPNVGSCLGASYFHDPYPLPNGLLCRQTINDCWGALESRAPKLCADEELEAKFLCAIRNASYLLEEFWPEE